MENAVSLPLVLAAMQMNGWMWGGVFHLITLNQHHSSLLKSMPITNIIKYIPNYRFCVAHNNLFFHSFSILITTFCNLQHNDVPALEIHGTVERRKKTSHYSKFMEEKERKKRPTWYLFAHFPVNTLHNRIKNRCADFHRTVFGWTIGKTKRWRCSFCWSVTLVQGP